MEHDRRGRVRRPLTVHEVSRGVAYDAARPDLLHVAPPLPLRLGVQQVTSSPGAPSFPAAPSFPDDAHSFQGARSFPRGIVSVVLHFWGP